MQADVRHARGAVLRIGTVLALCATVVSGVFAPSTARAAGASLSASPQTLVVAPGEQQRLEVIITTDVPTRGLQLALKWDPKVLQVDRVAAGKFYSDWATARGGQVSMIPQMSPDNAGGKTTIGGLAILGGSNPAGGNATDGPRGNGAALTVTVTGKQGAAGTTLLEFTNVVVSGVGGANNA